MIKVNELNFTYPNATSRTLHGLSYEIEQGEVFGLLGPSGAGKSTAQKIMMGLLKGYEGDVEVMGRQVRDWDTSLYEHVGVCFELPNHYLKLTAKENLDYFRSLYSGPVRGAMEVLEMVGLAQDAGKRVSGFSKGMKIRLNLARSILHHPTLLFLDEPTSGLDPVNARKMKDLILGLREEGTTVFVTTHNMVVADELCDRVGFVTQGHLQAVDSPEVLKRQYGRRELRVEHHSNGHLQVSTFDLDHLALSTAFHDLLKDSEKIESMHSQETTLEKVFIEVTGQELQS